MPLQAGEKPELVWVVSNAEDNRAVVTEQHEDHPGGWAIVGGDVIACVAKTPAIETALDQNLISEVGEPPDTIAGPDGKEVPNRYKPQPQDTDADRRPAWGPGLTRRLGRNLSKQQQEALGPQAQKLMAKREDEGTKEVQPPPQVVVPPMPRSEQEGRVKR